MVSSFFGGLGERLDRRISCAKRLCDETVLVPNVKVGDMLRLRGEPSELDGAGRSMRGMAGSDSPRIVRGEMSETESGDLALPMLLSGVKGANLGLESNFEGSSSICADVSASASTFPGMCSGFVTPRASSWAG